MFFFSEDEIQPPPEKFLYAEEPEVVVRFVWDDTLLQVYKLDFCGDVIYLKWIKRKADDSRGDTFIHFSCKNCDKTFVIRIDEDGRVFWNAEFLLGEDKLTNFEFLTEEELMKVLQEIRVKLREICYIHPSLKEVFKNIKEEE